MLYVVGSWKLEVLTIIRRVWSSLCWCWPPGLWSSDCPWCQCRASQEVPSSGKSRPPLSEFRYSDLWRLSRLPPPGETPTDRRYLVMIVIVSPVNGKGRGRLVPYVITVWSLEASTHRSNPTWSSGATDWELKSEPNLTSEWLPRLFWIVEMMIYNCKSCLITFIHWLSSLTARNRTLVSSLLYFFLKPKI